MKNTLYFDVFQFDEKFWVLDFLNEFTEYLFSVLSDRKQMSRLFLSRLFCVDENASHPLHKFSRNLYHLTSKEEDEEVFQGKPMHSFLQKETRRNELLPIQV